MRGFVFGLGIGVVVLFLWGGLLSFFWGFFGVSGGGVGVFGGGVDVVVGVSDSVSVVVVRDLFFGRLVGVDGVWDWVFGVFSLPVSRGGVSFLALHFVVFFVSSGVGTYFFLYK